MDDNSTCEIKKKITHLSKLIETALLIVWDEAPINNRCYFETLDRTMQDILGSSNVNDHCMLYGGKIVLHGGNFHQIILVIPVGIKEEIIYASLTSSRL